MGSQSPAADARTRGKIVVVVSEPVSEIKYTGSILSFTGSYGRIHCPEVKSQYDGYDTFLHINDCVDFKPKKGDEVVFQLAIDNKGNPKAVNAARPAKPIVINARDY